MALMADSTHTAPARDAAAPVTYPPLPLLSGCQCGPGCSCGCQSGGSCQCGGSCG
ncbi:hypothetical protein [Streptomyces gilvosporeus]|uniref:hypothetical protein n=1 Tax=Streptomyces gilvosporeus TaxID=553510 RepID=UPI000B068490|nr:hypothetical protein [Streptomyces gilvosporeus]